jgi:hypothetical protein
MRLLNTSTLELHEFYGKKVPNYAILSHRWEDGEITYKDVKKLRNLDAPGWTKVRKFCDLAGENDYEYAWIDTCCIDKTSSAELTEAINSMYRWYADSRICYVYLCDVTKIEHLHRSLWFTRGWTLQELLAPYNVVFISNDWKTVLGDKDSLDEILLEITGIDDITNVDITNKRNDISIATKMSWAAKRECTRVEDVAYSLLGIFGVNMPLLYGEGEKAFMRLQLEILKYSNDESIFAWGKLGYANNLSDEKDDLARGMLALDPSWFADARYVCLKRQDSDRPPYSMTNKGLEFQPLLISHPQIEHEYLLPLNCALKKPGEKEEGPLCLLLYCYGSTRSGQVREFSRYGSFLCPLGRLHSKDSHGFFSGAGSKAKQRQIIYVRQDGL